MTNPPTSDSPTPDFNDPAETATMLAALRRELDAESAWFDRAVGSSADAPEPHDFVGWLLRAARLAACGDTVPFLAWPGLATKLGIRVTDAIAEVAVTGIALLDESSGIPLGEAIADAEDASCLLMVEGELTGLLQDTTAWLQLWVGAAEEIPLDDLAFELVEQRRIGWPVPRAARLAIVATPLHEIDFLVAARASRPATRLAPVFDSAPELAHFDGGKPSPRMLDRFNARGGRGVTPSGLDLEVRAVLDEWWGVFVRIEGTAIAAIRHVRLGTLPLEEVADQPGLWTAVIDRMPLEAILRILNGDIAVRTDDGGRFLV
jgi:hypothetical protein